MLTDDGVGGTNATATSTDGKRPAEVHRPDPVFQAGLARGGRPGSVWRPDTSPHAHRPQRSYHVRHVRGHPPPLQHALINQHNTVLLRNPHERSAGLALSSSDHQSLDTYFACMISPRKSIAGLAKGGSFIRPGMDVIAGENKGVWVESAWMHTPRRLLASL